MLTLFEFFWRLHQIDVSGVFFQRPLQAMPCWMVARDSKQDPLSNAEWCTSHPKRRCWTRWGTCCWANLQLELDLINCFWWMFKSQARKTKTDGVFGKGLWPLRLTVPEGHDVEPLRLARFLDGQSFFRPPEISVLLRALQRNRWGIGKGFRGCLKWTTIWDTKSHQIASPNYKTIWISSKHRVVFFQPCFCVTGNIGTAYSFLLPSHPVIQRLVWHTSEILHKTIQTKRPQGHQLPRYLCLAGIRRNRTTKTKQRIFLLHVFQKSNWWNWVLGDEHKFKDPSGMLLSYPNKQAMLPGPLSVGAFSRAWVVAVVVAHRVDGSNNQWQRHWPRGGGLVMRGRFELKGWIFFLLKVEMRGQSLISKVFVNFFWESLEAWIFQGKNVKVWKNNQQINSLRRCCGHGWSLRRLALELR